MKDLILGVEIGGTKLQLAIGDFDGKLIRVHQGRVNADEGMEGILVWLKSNIIVLIEEYGKRLSGIGVGFGGPIETVSGRVLMSVQISGWENFKIKRWFEENFSLPVIVANDSNAACWGEYRCGSGRGAQQFLYMNIGSGLGGGLVVNGALYDGQGYGAAEIGQIYVPDWTSFEPGAAQRLEMLCSGWSIEKRNREKGYIHEDSVLMNLCGNHPEKFTCAMLGEAIDHKDGFAIKEIEYIAESIGIALSNVLSLLNPERVAIGGGVAKLGERIIEPIRRSVQRRVFVSSKERYVINECELGDEVVLVGAILLAKEAIV